MNAMDCPECGGPGAVVDHYHFETHDHPIFYCNTDNKFFTKIGEDVTQSG